MIKQVVAGVGIAVCVLSFAKTDWAGVSADYNFNLPTYRLVKYEPHIELNVTATAYWYMDPIDASGTGIAYDGKPAVPYKTIAVDPKVIPMGSKVYVPDIGWCIAHDTGSAIKGNRIDIAMDTKENALKWGKKTLVVKVIPPRVEHKYKMQILDVSDSSIVALSTNHPQKRY